MSNQKKLDDMAKKTQHNKQNEKANSKRKPKKVNKTLYHLRNILLLVISGLCIYSFTSELSTTFALNKDISDAKELAAQLADERATLEKQQEMLQDPNYVINYARGKLLISQDGEQIFYLDGDE